MSVSHSLGKAIYYRRNSSIRDHDIVMATSHRVKTLPGGGKEGKGTEGGRQQRRDMGEEGRGGRERKERDPSGHRHVTSHAVICVKMF